MTFDAWKTRDVGADNDRTGGHEYQLEGKQITQQQMRRAHRREETWQDERHVLNEKGDVVETVRHRHSDVPYRAWVRRHLAQRPQTARLSPKLARILGGVS